MSLFRWLLLTGLAGAGLAGAAVWASVRWVPFYAMGQPVEPGAEAQPAQFPAVPRVVVDVTEVSLGDVEPSGPREHVFWVRNEGTAPLRLERGGTSCKCTMSDLPTDPIPPGQKAPVRVATKTTEGHFSHEAVIVTNDPQCPTLRLRISGTIRSRLAADPPRAVFPTSRGDEAQSTSLLLYSQTWDRFEILGVEVSKPDIRWKLTPANAARLASHQARSGYHLEVSVPPTLPGRSFWEWIQITAAPPGTNESPRTLKLDVCGTVLKRVGIFGDKLDSQGTVQFGTLECGQGAKTRLMVKVRDNHRALAVLGIHTRPDFVRASLAPLNADALRYGLYRLEIEVPADAPLGSWVGDSVGEVRVVTDHPENPEIVVPVAFIVRRP